MLEKSKRGIQFTENKNSDIVKRIIAMTQMTGFNVCLEFFALLYDLSTNPRQRILASGTFDNDSILRDSKSRRIAKINEYINNNYINDIRISNATKMLFETTNSISEIAFLCGFNNISNFNRIFKKNKGKTPSEYRESIQKIMIKY